MKTQEKTIDVTHEAANVYYQKFKELPPCLRNKISLEMLDHIFKQMVVPAIDHARSIGRNYEAK